MFGCKVLLYKGKKIHWGMKESIQKVLTSDWQNVAGAPAWTKKAYPIYKRLVLCLPIFLTYPNNRQDFQELAF